MRRLLAVFLMICCSLPIIAQRTGMYKMSPMLRELVNTQERSVCAFIRITEDGSSVLEQHGCRELARFGNIYIADIPVGQLRRLASLSSVSSIEANGHATTLMDTTLTIVNAHAAHEGRAPLPQAFAGKGVVMGVMDVGFDLTHPTFYDSEMQTYRIKRLWDQLSPDTEESSLYVGRDYKTEEELLTVGHSYDGLIMNHGTHTLSTAAGSGYDSPYRGVAYESDMCVVANATTENVRLIPQDLRDKYTYAVDALGFKYIFDYAEEVGKPCVISFSEGSTQDFLGYDKLYYEVLDSLTGPGRIIVSSAGNNSLYNTYFHKVRGEESAGTFLWTGSDHVSMAMKSKDDFQIRLKAFMENKDTTILIATRAILELPDSQYVDTTKINGRQYVFQISAYPSCYNDDELVYDAYFSMLGRFGYDVPVSMEIIGREADVEVYKLSGYWVANDLNPALTAGEKTHNINSPSSAPCVISVGATSYRTGFTNHLGNYVSYHQGEKGERGFYSSVGPTFDGRMKPEVMAPGTNIVAAANSFFRENNPESTSLDSDIAYFELNGRTYGWHSKAGTSMSSPVVGGAVAVWLQANPELTPDDVRRVFSRTCKHYDESLTYPNNEYGYGEIDVYHGLLDILGVTAIQGVSTRQPQGVRVIPLSGGCIGVSFDEPMPESFRVRLYSVGGVLIDDVKFSGGQQDYTLSLPLAYRGVVVVQVSTSEPSTTGSTLIRID